jgi:hypothetical protein
MFLTIPEHLLQSLSRPARSHSRYSDLRSLSILGPWLGVGLSTVTTCTIICPIVPTPDERQ